MVPPFCAAQNDPAANNAAETGSSNGESIQQSFIVTPSNCLFTYNYAVVLSDAPHNKTTNPYFSVQVQDAAGTLITCLNYFIETDTTGLGKIPPGFKKSANTDAFGTEVVYLPWQSSSINLQPYMGTNVKVTFTAAGCEVGGHFGYAYVDCSCSPLGLIFPSGPVCPGKLQTITAPADGTGTYAWTGPGIVGTNTVQTVTADQPGTYTVTITNQSGCKYTLDTNLLFIQHQPWL